jgi:hypothetical protein
VSSRLLLLAGGRFSTTRGLLHARESAPAAAKHLGQASCAAHQVSKASHGLKALAFLTCAESCHGILAFDNCLLLLVL